MSTDAASRKIPIFGNWRRAYLAVLAAFVLEVALLCAFTRVFS